jgi:hypothetical protein
METGVDEVAPQIYRLSTYVEPANFTFNQYLINADEPLLFHTGGRRCSRWSVQRWRASCRSSGCAG